MNKQNKSKHSKSLLKKKFAEQVSLRAAQIKKDREKRKETSLGKQLLVKGGTALGSLIGLGREGGQVGSFFSKILGMGSYTLNQNCIMNNSTQAPVFNGSDRSLIFSHDEMVTDITSSTSFSSFALNIDPTNNSTFPMLSELASNFEQYEFLGLVFTYKPTSGSAIASTNNALGTVIISTEYDVSKPQFINKPDMEAYQFSTSCEPSSIMHHPVECNPKKEILNARYVASGTRLQRRSTYTNLNNTSVASNLNYLGRTQVATVGMQAAGVTVGELWVSYKVKLSIPRKVSSSNTQMLFHASSSVDIPNGTNNVALASNYNVMSDSTASLGGLDFTVSGSNSLLTFYNTPPRTKFLVILTSTGTGSVAQGTMTTSGSIAPVSYWNADSNANGSTSMVTPVGTQPGVSMLCVNTTDTGYSTPGVVTIPAFSVSASGGAKWDLTVITVPYISVQNAGAYILTAQEKSDLDSAKLERLERMLAQGPSSVVSCSEEESKCSDESQSEIIESETDSEYKRAVEELQVDEYVREHGIVDLKPDDQIAYMARMDRRRFALGGLLTPVSSRSQSSKK